MIESCWGSTGKMKSIFDFGVDTAFSLQWDAGWLSGLQPISKCPLGLGLGGGSGSGKSTVAMLLEDRLGYRRISFATPIREILSEQVFSPLSIPTQYLYESKDEPVPADPEELARCMDGVIRAVGGSKADVLRAASVETILKVRSIPGRWLMRMVGDAGRERDEDYWIHPVREYLDTVGPLFVIDDVRFGNERKFIRSVGGSIIRLSRTDSKPDDSHLSEKSYGSDSEYDAVIQADPGDVQKLVDGVVDHLIEVMRRVTRGSYGGRG